MGNNQEQLDFGAVDTDHSTRAGAAGRRHRGDNLLNDLDTREWLIATKSVWYKDVADLEAPQLVEITSSLRQTLGDEHTEEILGQIFGSVLLSKPPTRDPVKLQHPATFAESDIVQLIRFFTKEGERVLDPFLGSGSTLVACQQAGRDGVGIEVIDKWADIARHRVANQPRLFAEFTSQTEVVTGDALAVLQQYPDESFQFLVTSPPYWSMLNKPADHKVKKERLGKGLPTRYSEHPADLANVTSYQEFLDGLAAIFSECYRVLQAGRYAAVIVSDFRDKAKFHMFHADVANVLERSGLPMSGITILVQDSKTLYPYGMPHAFVSNIHHQYVLIARRPRDK